jgi:hypothetical protein
MQAIMWRVMCGLVAGVLIGLGAGCEETETNKREVRVQNESAAAVRVLIDDAEVLQVAANDDSSVEVGAGLLEVRLLAEDGHTIWEQYVDLAAGQYARFKVKADGTVVGSGGLTYDPRDAYPVYATSSDHDPELRLSNHRSEPVHIWIDSVEKKVVSPGDVRSIDPGGGRCLVEFKTSGGAVLFTQEVSFKDGQYILYTIEQDGSVVVSGGQI